MIVNDYSRYTWVLFLANKDDALDAFKVLCKKIQNEKGYGIACIGSDHGGEFENYAFETFCNNLGIVHNFHHLELHNKMELLRERIGLFKK